MTRVIVNERKGPYTIRKADVEGETITICGCGLTAEPPYCDDSHLATRREPPGKLVRYPGNDDANPPVEVDARLLDPS